MGHTQILPFAQVEGQKHTGHCVQNGIKLVQVQIAHDLDYMA